jgi:calcium/calmodulin-dependent protein kinase I
VLHDLAHPNICNLVEVFAENAFRVSLVFELCAGGELFDAIVRRDHFSEPEARDIMRGLIRGVAYLHSNNVVHRDLKPENILISRANGDLRHLKIADFGFATKVDPKSPHQLTRVVGTPGYMSPEVLTPGTGYGLEVDVWALGVIAYILFCGYAPFQHDDDTALREMIKRGTFKFEDNAGVGGVGGGVADEDSRVWRSVSPAAKQLISGALVVDRSRRCDVYDMWAHPWLNGASALSVATSPPGNRGSGIRLSPQNSPARDQMRRYQVKKRLRATMTVIRAVGRMSAMRRATQNQGIMNIEMDDDDEMMLDESI